MCQNLNTWGMMCMNQDQMRKVVSGIRVTGTIRFLVNDRGLQILCARVLHETAYASSYVW